MHSPPNFATSELFNILKKTNFLIEEGKNKKPGRAAQ